MVALGDQNSLDLVRKARLQVQGADAVTGLTGRLARALVTPARGVAGFLQVAIAIDQVLEDLG